VVQIEYHRDIVVFHPDGQKYHDFKEAGVVPNQHPVEVFGIKKVFTDANKDSSKLSRTTNKKMRVACNIDRYPAGDWTGIRRQAFRFFDDYMERTEEYKSINFAELVHFITSKVSITYLFDNAETVFESQDAFEDIKLIDHRINELWIESKKPDGERPR
jgi:hypothetical protein